jgi:hypothetical protein
MAHIGPITNAMWRPSFSPHSQHSFCCTVLVSQRPSTQWKSGLPSIHSTNFGTG